METRAWRAEGRKQNPENGGWALPGVLNAGLWNLEFFRGTAPDLRTRQAGQGPIWRGPGIKASGREELSPEVLLFPIKALGSSREPGPPEPHPHCPGSSGRPSCPQMSSSLAT